MKKTEKTEMLEGFVVGYDIVGRRKEKVWKVRVLSEGPLNGKKLEVGTPPLCVLAKGMIVQFATADFLIGKDRKVRKAVEVQLVN